MSKMCTKLIVLAVLLLAATFASATAVAEPHPKKTVYTFSKYIGDKDAWQDGSSASGSGSDSYAYLILALQKCNDNSPWTIHGLWPSYASGNSGPEFCTTQAFSQALVQDLWQQIDQYWPTCSWSGNTEDQFLSHEWSKHGTCTGETQHAYFAQVLNLFLQGGWQSHCTSTEKECKITVNKS
jgi:ribonuclease I